MEDNDFGINIAPDTIHGMLRWVLDECVGEKNLGGFVTKYIDRPIAWLVSPATEYPQPGRAEDLSLRKLLPS